MGTIVQKDGRRSGREKENKGFLGTPGLEGSME